MKDLLGEKPNVNNDEDVFSTLADNTGQVSMMGSALAG